MKQADINTIPNHEYLELNYVAETATGKGNNQQIIMQVNANNKNVFDVTEGRIGIRIGRNRPRTYSLPMTNWDSFYLSKVNRGWLLTKTQKMEKKKITKKGLSFNGGTYAQTGIFSVDSIITKLLSYANKVISDNYSTSVEDISDEMLEYGNSILTELAKNHDSMSIAEFNNKLKVLYAAIPRRMDNLSKHLAKRKIEFVDIIDKEQELFDIVYSQVRSNSNLAKYDTMPTVLQAYGLEWRPVSNEEETKIKKLMGENAKQYKNAWRIINKKTEKAFNEYCAKENLSDENNGISHLFHGSRSENFWSIITNGLTINPVGVVTNGKMFGLGTYFANKAKKSMGYTSSSGSYWTHGSEAIGYLGIFKVATGKTYDVTSAESDLTYNVLQQRCPGAHCTFAHAGHSLCNDEIIVYQDQQSTIEYFVEFTAAQ